MACCAFHSYYEPLPNSIKIDHINRNSLQAKSNAFYAVGIGTIQVYYSHTHLTTLDQHFFSTIYLGCNSKWNFFFPFQISTRILIIFGVFLLLLYDQCCVCVIPSELQQQCRVSSSCGSHTTTISFVFVYIYSSSDNIG